MAQKYRESLFACIFRENAEKYLKNSALAQKDFEEFVQAWRISGIFRCGYAEEHISVVFATVKKQKLIPCRRDACKEKAIPEFRDFVRDFSGDFVTVIQHTGRKQNGGRVII